jgi:tRNA1Val (adenine37-N6)-methyltransferase
VKFTKDSIKDITILQPARGYRFSVDALLLEQFISAKRLSRGIELGTGSGIISILLAKKLKHVRIQAIEIQRSLARCAEQNVVLNKVEDRVKVATEDIKNLKKTFPANTFDFVFSNPPFRKMKTGLLSFDEERAAARHEINITLNTLIQTASYLLKNTGKFYMIYHPFRLIELISIFQSSKLEPKRMRFVHSRIGEDAKIVLIEAVKGSGAWLKVEPPFYIYEKGSKYTVEMKKIYGE